MVYNDSSYTYILLLLYERTESMKPAQLRVRSQVPNPKYVVLFGHSGTQKLFTQSLYTSLYLTNNNKTRHGTPLLWYLMIFIEL